MIPLSLGEIAAVVGGAVEGDGAVTVTAPAVVVDEASHLTLRPRRSTGG
jgi:hypothetical protein